MSNEAFCYVDKKAIRLPIMGEIPVVDMESELNIKKIGESIEYNPKITPKDNTPFWANFVDSQGKKYVDLVLSLNYSIIPCSKFDWDDDSPSRCKTQAEYLSDKEKEFFSSHFNKLGIDYNVDNLRKIDCYWWCYRKQPDCYDVKELQDYTTLI